MIHFPVALTVSASAGTGQAARDPAQAIRPPRITTTALASGAAPVPSTSVPPTSALAGGGTFAVGNGVITATPQPARGLTKTLLLPTRALPAQSPTREPI